MKINRDNYETFFLLYTDDELPVRQRVEVDEFVKANPDLQEELLMLQQAVLKPEPVSFVGREVLLKAEYVPTPLQEKLLLFLDNELSVSEMDETASAISADETLGKEWSILQQTRVVTTEHPVFKGRRSLYRTETRVVSLAWRRVAVAAAITGLAVWAGLAYVSKGSLPKNMTVSNTRVAPTPQGTNKKVAEKTIIEKGPDIIHPGDKPLDEQPDTQNKLAVAAKRFSRPKAENTHDRVAQNSIALKRSKDLPTPHVENLNAMRRNNTEPLYVTLEGRAAPMEHPGKAAITTSFASSASFAEGEEQNNDRVFFMDEQKIRKTRLGGIFRKVKRVLERNTSIKAGNKIRVANLEFAIQ